MLKYHVAPFSLVKGPHPCVRFVCCASPQSGRVWSDGRFGDAVWKHVRAIQSTAADTKAAASIVPTFCRAFPFVFSNGCCDCDCALFDNNLPIIDDALIVVFLFCAEELRREVFNLCSIYIFSCWVYLLLGGEGRHHPTAFCRPSNDTAGSR